MSTWNIKQDSAHQPTAIDCHLLPVVLGWEGFWSLWTAVRGSVSNVCHREGWLTNYVYLLPSLMFTAGNWGQEIGVTCLGSNKKIGDRWKIDHVFFFWLVSVLFPTEFKRWLWCLQSVLLRSCGSIQLSLDIVTVLWAKDKYSPVQGHWRLASAILVVTMWLRLIGQWLHAKPVTRVFHVLDWLVYAMTFETWTSIRPFYRRGWGWETPMSTKPTWVNRHRTSAKCQPFQVTYRLPLTQSSHRPYEVGQ